MVKRLLQDSPNCAFGTSHQRRLLLKPLLASSNSPLPSAVAASDAVLMDARSICPRLCASPDASLSKGCRHPLCHLRTLALSQQEFRTWRTENGWCPGVHYASLLTHSFYTKQSGPQSCQPPLGMRGTWGDPLHMRKGAHQATTSKAADNLRLIFRYEELCLAVLASTRLHMGRLGSAFWPCLVSYHL